MTPISMLHNAPYQKSLFFTKGVKINIVTVNFRDMTVFVILKRLCKFGDLESAGRVMSGFLC